MGEIVVPNDPYEPSFIARLLYHNGANSQSSSLLTNILTTFIFAKSKRVTNDVGRYGLK